jgi:hypothetical protein
MADALSLGVTYSSVKGRVLPSPMEHAPSSLLAALFFHSPCAAFALLQNDGWDATLPPTRRCSKVKG